AVVSCVSQLGEVPAEANLGFVYVSDRMAGHLTGIVARLKQLTGMPHWVGSSGIGICCTNQEYLDQAAMVVMLGSFPAGSFRVISTLRTLEEVHSALAPGDGQPYFGIVHADPENPEVPALIPEFASRMESGFVVGGITSSRSQHVQVADEVTQGGLSGVVFSAEVGVSTRLTQGVSPLGTLHVVTECDRNVVSQLDHRPALEVLREEIGELLFRDPNRMAEYVFVGLPIPGSDTGDYVVRNLVGMDLDKQLLAISEYVQPGMTVMFCRRDGASAVEDMQAGLSGAPVGGLYFSCLGRGESMFGAGSAELKMISQALGDVPIVGFFANGEISHNRIYGYTGVLTLFVQGES
ncbi:MAG TPA: FIST N-terminal domain-containing protein, partial [Gallionellaceae bacterium]